MSTVRLSGVTYAFGSLRAVDSVDLLVPQGSLTAVLGPSGCGKTTLLRLVAGFLSPQAGTIRFDDRVVADQSSVTPPQERRVGYVPQEGALFPHLDVAANIGFGLPKAQRRSARVAEMLDLVELPRSYAERAPHELSGGQQQRVALARALAPAPSVVLLDEPFSSLDASLRVSTGRAVSHALRTTGTTAVLVTHDQDEALSLADQVAVMRRGRLVQADRPRDLYRTPADADVARFVGGAAILPATVAAGIARCALGEAPVQGRSPTERSRWWSVPSRSPSARATALGSATSPSTAMTPPYGSSCCPTGPGWWPACPDSPRPIRAPRSGSASLGPCSSSATDGGRPARRSPLLRLA
jgi:iron(III) transport system ATP-binding protein